MALLKSVRSFNDYKKYLQHFYETKKEERLSYSYREFSETAGIHSANYLKLVISGKKRLTVTNIHQFAKAMSLSLIEHELFETLVFFNQAKSEVEKDYYQRRLASLKKGYTHSKSHLTGKEVLSRWYLPALLLLLDGLNSEVAASQTASFARRFNLQEGEINEAVRHLLKAQVISNDGGIYKMHAKYLYSQDRKSADLSHRKFLESQLQQSQFALSKKYSSGAKFYSHTLKLNQEAIPQIQNMFQKFLEEITRVSDDEIGSQLVQINAQIFIPG